MNISHSPKCVYVTELGRKRDLVRMVNIQLGDLRAVVDEVFFGYRIKHIFLYDRGILGQ